MNLRDLHYFVVLADVMHFGEAAKRCHVSQPTLSMQIKKLEEELGIVLFERNNKQVMLTEAGRALLGRAQQVLTNVAEMKELARQSADPYAGELHLGVIPTLAPYLLPHVMPAIQAAFPKLNIWLIEDKTHRLIEKLAGGQLDAAIMATPVEAEFSQRILFEEPFYFVSAKTPNRKKAAMEVNDLANEQVMLLEEGHCLREQAMAVCQLAKAEMQANFSATSLETLRFMVQAGLGVTLLPALSIYDNQQGLQVIPFAKPAPFRTIALYSRPGSAKLACLQAIGDIIRTTIQRVIGTHG
ncbi:hydrogen peroxide-inducible genes activator [Legionella lansingensis]|uniref:Transcriptional regulator n=1 Tax=Legionella lansingensis TaxID=45067 RepID=A0A0W0W1S3_9GAMM|nr:LysR substrate-binding domain-containing protein [Legionella lansingensis]KTD26126.1 transcriptional regulator [Legionella lansingensis]SNV52650.1 hydrogen peroxide-inducible genes activator [Legionella lansingensis]